MPKKEQINIKTMNYKLHYASIECQEDIPCFEFETFDELKNHILSILFGSDESCFNRVYLFTYEEIVNNKNGIDGAILIEDNVGVLTHYLQCMEIEGLEGSLKDLFHTYYLQEYSSYEEAYKVALSMREQSPLCY